jgi:hypothetical protein
LDSTLRFEEFLNAETTKGAMKTLKSEKKNTTEKMVALRMLDP